MKLLCVTLCSLFISITLFSQYRNCPTTANMQLMAVEDPDRYQRFMALEQFTNNLRNQAPALRLINDNGNIIIPVVVHIMHRNEREGNGRNLSEAQIRSQIDVLNEDFRRLNADRVNTAAPFLPVAADFNLEFRLACVDPIGLPTNGIVRKYTIKKFFYLSASGVMADEEQVGIKFSNRGGDDAWPTDRYLNIWVGKFGDGINGYATFPADYVDYPNVDGIVVDTDAFGRDGSARRPYHKGRTATHEVGHWLNLRHIWGDTYCGTDFVDDTPIQAKANGGCPDFPYFSNCPGRGPNGDMFMNFMDYTNDECGNVYTAGQRFRARALFATGGPRAAFIDHYFKILPPRTAVNCQARIKLQNPACLPVNWSVVSGPATVAPSATANTAIISASGVGNVLLRAVSGNYISEITLPVNLDPPQINGFITELSFCLGGSDWELRLSANANEQDIITGYTWSRDGVTIPGLNSNLFYTYEFPPACMKIGVRGTNICGTGIEATEVFCPPCPSFRIQITQNPIQTNTTLKVNLQWEREAANMKRGRLKFKLIETATGRIVKQWEATRCPTLYLNLQGIKPGAYTLSGEYGVLSSSTHLMIGQQ